MRNQLTCEPIKPTGKNQFIGTFGMEDFELRYESELGNTTSIVTGQPIIEFGNERTNDLDELKIYLQEFIETTITSAFSSGSISITAQQIEMDVAVPVEITETGFLVENFNNTVRLAAENESITLGFNCIAEGKITDGRLCMDFKIILPGNGGDTILISGSAVGRRN